MTKLNMAVNKYSSKLTQNKSQGASQAMLYATGLKEEDLDKAQVAMLSNILLHYCTTSILPY